MPKIDLNCDMGEGFGAWEMGNDDAMLELVSTVNLACGFHAGDPSIMGRICAQAVKRGVAVGAHPGYPDLWGFGRRPMAFSPEALKNILAYQIGAAEAVAKLHGHRLTHVKVHGEMAHVIANNEEMSQMYVSTHKRVCGDMYVTVMATSQFEHTALASGLKVAHEIFADRAYLEDGRLMPRSLPGSVIHDPEVAAKRVLEMVQGQYILTAQQKRLHTPIDTVCMHGDTPEAVGIARAVRNALEKAGYEIAAFRGDRASAGA